MPDRVLGAAEVARRVAHQAADYADVSVETMLQVLPVLAGIRAGGMYQWTTTQGRGLQNSTPPSAPSKGSEGQTNPWAELWAVWATAASPEKKPASNPLEELMSGFLQLSPPPNPAPQPEPSPSLPWTEMMETGRDMQMQYLASLQSIFESASKTTDKKP